MIEKFKLLFRYLGFRCKVQSIYKIHSPFVYDFYINVLQKNKKPLTDQVVKTIFSYRRNIFKNNNNYLSEDTGQQSRSTGALTIGEKARRISQPHNGGMFLARLVHFLSPENIIELGTGAGISTIYMALANKKIPVFTIEGNPVMSQVASGVFKETSIENITLFNGLFDYELPKILQITKSTGLVFIDGDHSSTALLRYFDLISNYITEETVIVLHDIYWSTDMLNAWKHLLKNPSVSLSIDTFDFGILFFKKRMNKEHFLLR
jgi:predicted O-methyltransferase YrrM